MTKRIAPILSLLVLAAALFLLGGCSSSGSQSTRLADDPGTTGPVANAREIEGVEWKVVSSSEEDFTSFGMTATFRDGTVAGNGAVNSYSAPCVLGDDGSVEVGDVTSTLMAGPEASNAAEARYFELLKSMVTYRFEGEDLVLSDAADKELTLRR